MSWGGSGIGRRMSWDKFDRVEPILHGAEVALMHAACRFLNVNQMLVIFLGRSCTVLLDAVSRGPHIDYQTG